MTGQQIQLKRAIPRFWAIYALLAVVCWLKGIVSDVQRVERHYRCINSERIYSRWVLRWISLAVALTAGSVVSVSVLSYKGGITRPDRLEELADVLEAVRRGRTLRESLIMQVEYFVSRVERQCINQKENIVVILDSSCTHLHREHVLGGCGRND